MKQHCSLIIVVILFFSCSKLELNNQLLEIKSENAEVINMVNLIDSIEIIHISQENSKYLTELSDLFILDGCYYILDKKTNTVKKYTKSGELLVNFDRKGRSLNEYTNIKDISYDDDHIYILTVFKIIILDKDLNIEDVLVIKKTMGSERNIFLDRIAIHNNNILLYENHTQSIYSLSKKGYDVKKVLTDESLLTEKRICDKIGMSNDNPIFHKIDDSQTLVNMHGSEYVYEIDRNDSISTWKLLNYPNKEGDHKRLIAEINDSKIRQTYKPPYIKNIFTVGSNYFINYMFGIAVLNNQTNRSQDFIRTPSNLDDLSDVYISWNCVIGNKLYALNHVEGANIQKANVGIKKRFGDKIRSEFASKSTTDDSNEVYDFLIVYTLKNNSQSLP